MQATTIKLTAPLIGDLRRVKPKSLTLTAFVRVLLERAVRWQRMSRAATAYHEFVGGHPDETRWLAEWETADLAHAPRRVRRRRPA